MEKTEAQKLLDRMRKALKDGRARREHDRKMGCIAQGDVLTCGTQAEIDAVQTHLASRGMLTGKDQVFANRYVLKGGAIDLREREKDQKRPSVRAARKNKTKDRGLDI